MTDKPMSKKLERRLMKALADTLPKETPEETAAREAKEAEEKARWEKIRKEQEEAVRFAVPRQIEALRKEAASKLEEADKLAALFAEFPGLLRREGRWKKIAFYAKEANGRVDRFDMRHNCGCCRDSPLEIWPYLETPNGNVYSDPPMFNVGEADPTFGGDIPSPGWDEGMRAAGIPEVIIGAVQMHFERSAARVREQVEETYGDQ